MVACADVRATDSAARGFQGEATASDGLALARRVSEAASLLRGAPIEASGLMVVADGAAGQPGVTGEASLFHAGPGFFETMGNRMVAGRAITWEGVHYRMDIGRKALSR